MGLFMKNILWIVQFLGILIFIGSDLSWASDNESSKVDVEEMKDLGKASKKVEIKQGPAYLKSIAAQKELIDGIEETLGHLNDLIDQFPKGSEQRLRMLEKILGLHFEQASYVSADEQRKYEDLWSKWDIGGQTASEPTLDHSASRKHWESVSKMSRLLLSEFPKTQNADRVNYHDAIALQFLGKTDESARSFTALIKNYPTSSIVYDAEFSLGEYYFDKSQFDVALRHYQATLKSPSKQRVGWGMYKVGWCLYNLKHYEESLNSWKQAVTFSEQIEEGGKLIREEVLRDMLLAFIEYGTVDDGISYYSQQNAVVHIPRLLRLIASRYIDQGRYEEGIALLKRLITTKPDSKESFDANIQILSLYHEKKRYDNLWDEIELFNKRFGENSIWLKKSKAEDAQISRQRVQTLTLYYPKIIHKKAQDKKDKALMQVAKKGYYIYLKLYPQSIYYAEVVQYLADIEYAGSLYENAGNLYMKIVELGKDKAHLVDSAGKVKESIHEKCSKNMLDAFSKNVLPELTALMKETPNFKAEPKPLSEKSKKFIKACQMYTESYPSDLKLVRDCDVYVGEIYFRSADKKQAREALWKIIKKYPKSKEGPLAVEQLIPMLQSNAKDLLEVVNQVLAVEEYKKPPLGTKLKALTRTAYLESIKVEKSPFKRAKLFEDYSRTHPEDPDVDKLLFNAGNEYIASGSSLKAISVFTLLVNKYPKSSAAQNAYLFIGKLSDSSLAYKEAAQAYANFALRFPQAKESVGALLRACDLDIAMDYTHALKSCRSFASKQPKEGMFQIEKIIETAYRSKDYAFMNNVILSEYLHHFTLSTNQKILAFYKIYKTAQSPQEKNAARDRILTVSREGQVSGEALRYLTGFIFESVDNVHLELRAMSLKGGTVEALQSSIQAISAKLATLESRYGKVLATRDSYWGVAVLYRLGEAYEDFARKLSQPPAVQGANPQDVKSQLRGSMMELQAKAKDFYQSGLETSRKFEIYSEWVLLIRQALSRMSGKMISTKDLVLPPDYVGGLASNKVLSGLGLDREDSEEDL